MAPYLPARLPSYLRARVPKLSLQHPGCANFMGPGEHEVARCGHDLGCLGRPSTHPNPMDSRGRGH